MRTRIERQQMPPPPPPDSAYCQENNRENILGTVGAMMTMAIVLFSMRITVRTFLIKSMGADDYVMLVALILAVATYVCFVFETEYAVGKHVGCITQHEFEKFSKWQYFHALCVMIGVVLVKISIALFLMRLVPPGKRWKGFLWAAIVFLACFCLACMGTLIWSCVPIAASWNFELRMNPSTKCFSNRTFVAIGLVNSSINCTTDFLFAIIPVPIILKLQVDRYTKVSLACILSLGYFACAAGIVKAVKQHSLFSESDPLWHDTFNVWNMIELCVGIVAASLPALRPLFVKILERTRLVFSEHSPSSSSSRDRERLDRSAGYLRKQSLHGTEHGGDVMLDVWKWKNATNSTGTTDSQTKTLAEHKEDYHGTDVAAMVNRPYTIAMKTGLDPSDDGSWEDIEVLRSQSEETLTRPSGSFNTMELPISEEHTHIRRNESMV